MPILNNALSWLLAKRLTSAEIHLEQALQPGNTSLVARINTMAALV